MNSMIKYVDCHDGIKRLKDKSIHLVVTSPPYFNAKEYVHYSSYADYLDKMKIIIQHIHRVLKDGRFFCINTSPVIQPRKNRQDKSKRLPIPFDVHHIITQCGFEFIDDIVWIKPEGSALNRNGNFFQHRRPLAYKPNVCVEYIMVYRKQTDKLIDWNMRQYDEKIIKMSLVRGEYEKSNAWYIQPETQSDHEAPFPLEIPLRLIRFYSYVGDIVLDPFIGSGTTAVACKMLHRKCVGFEINEKNKTIIDQRLHATKSLHVTSMKKQKKLPI